MAFVEFTGAALKLGHVTSMFRFMSCLECVLVGNVARSKHLLHFVSLLTGTEKADWHRREEELRYCCCSFQTNPEV
jgi:hypothetical protein